MKHISEIYLNSSEVSTSSWQALINEISKYNGLFRKWQLIVEIKDNKINYYIKTNFIVPTNISGFLTKKIESTPKKEHYITLPTFIPLSSNIIDTINYCHVKNIGNLKYITITFKKYSDEKILSKTHIYYEYQDKLIKSRVLLSIPSTLLSVNFQKYNTYIYKKIPKYFDISKILHSLKTDKVNSTLEVNTFPYLDGKFYLNNNDIDFAKHSLILGSSGSGKSKYISLFIKNIYDNYKDKYKIVMIDPHASLEYDIGGISKTIDFKSIEDSINLFANNSNDTIATTELTLDLFKTLLSDQYNSKLERVLRHTIYLLLSLNSFNFQSLKNILIDPLYRTEKVEEVKDIVPESIIHFFLNDFNDLKTKSYSEAISPIISFIDEMEMIPVFNRNDITTTLKDTISSNFITLFSLDKTTLGDKVTKTISGFIMQQLLTLIQNSNIDEHIIFIIDEVPLIENNILCRFLSEARKYNLSLILAAQYFNQISPSLKDSIFANVINYYIFRVSRSDATTLVDHLDMKIPNLKDKDIGTQKEEKINILSNLNNRECIVRISSNNVLAPSIHARTLDYMSNPRIKKETISNIEVIPKSSKSTSIAFNINNIDLNDVLKSTSSSRIVVK